MKILQIKSVTRCLVGCCLMIAFAVSVIGCDSPDAKPPSKGDSPAVEMDIKGSDSSSNTSSEKSMDEEKSETPAATGSKTPNQSSSADLSGASKTMGDDTGEASPSPSLNAPKLNAPKSVSPD